MIVLGLTGSIGMGKSTTAAMFGEFGAPVFDADACVHQLYSGEAVDIVERSFPSVTVENRIDRTLLGARILQDREAMARLEKIIHPLVGEKRKAFLKEARATGARLAVLDVPLLFETHGETSVDAVVVVTATAEIQRQRVLARPDMNETKFVAMRDRQMADRDKRRRAHFIVETSGGLATARRQIRTIVSALRGCERRGKCFDGQAGQGSR